MRHLKNFLIFSMTFIPLHAIDIPKSSLETVKQDIVDSLKKAEVTHDAASIEKHQKELVEIDKKIQKFKQEWLEFRKNQLSAQSSTPEIATELQEIERLLKAEHS